MMVAPYRMPGNASDIWSTSAAANNLRAKQVQATLLGFGIDFKPPPIRRLQSGSAPRSGQPYSCSYSGDQHGEPYASSFWSKDAPP
ncbi:MAG: hypothetical protein ACYTFG_00130 [Planctomycetota bacterium]|jgi:hypothetical protein